MEHFRIKDVVVEYDETLSLAILTYDCKFVIHEELVKANQAFLELIQSKKCTCALYDIAGMGLIPKESQEWSVQFFMPKLNEVGLHYMASVYSKDIFNKVSVNKMKDKVQLSYMSEMFGNKADAIKWLKEQSSSKRQMAS
jgi:hypothetical protein